MTSRTIMITGATDGIGLALARQLDAAGHRLILVGRRKLAQLDDVLFTPETYARVDLARSDRADRLQQWLTDHAVAKLDVVVHNAGTAFYGQPAQQPGSSIDTILAVNLEAPIELTQMLLPLVKAARGRIAFVSSVAAQVPAADYAVYAASKAALNGFARSLRTELADQATVQVISPGATQTGMHGKIGYEPEANVASRFATSEAVAAELWRAVESNRFATTLGFSNKLLTFAGTYARPIVDAAINRRQGTKPQPAGAPLAVITGAADGIGRALALRYAQGGYRVHLVDRDGERAASVVAEIEAAGGRAVVTVADLSQPDHCVRAVRALVEAGDIQVLIHNAGISAVGRFEELSWRTQQNVIDINLRAPLQMTAGLLRRGALDGADMVFLSSLSQFVGYPGAATYGATKDGLFSYARSIAAVLAQHGGGTTTVFPGPTRTAHARRYSPDNSREDRRMPPEAVANVIFRAQQRGQRVAIPGLPNRLLAIAGRLAPRAMERSMRQLIYAQLPASTTLTESETE